MYILKIWIKTTCFGLYGHHQVFVSWDFTI